jgi:hypothetical protein
LLPKSLSRYLQNVEHSQNPDPKKPKARPPFFRLLFLATVATPFALLLLTTGCALIIGTFGLPLYVLLKISQGHISSGIIVIAISLASARALFALKQKYWEPLNSLL